MGNCAEAALEGLEVLEAEDGGGREDGDLLAVLHGLEGGAHGDFGFAVADVAAEQAIHGRGRLHVVLDVADGRELVVGLVVVEGVFELASGIRCPARRRCPRRCGAGRRA